jgi:hypothetical protein
VHLLLDRKLSLVEHLIRVSIDFAGIRALIPHFPFGAATFATLKAS